MTWRSKQLMTLKKYYLSIISISVIPRLIWVLFVDVIPLSDFNTYHIIAEAMTQGKVTGNNYIALFPNYFYYPAFLSLFYRLFSASPIVAQLLNVVLAAIVAILIFNIGKLAKNDKVGFIAAIIWALWPSQIFYSELVATETLFISLLLFSIFAFYKILHSKLPKLVCAVLFAIFGVLCSVLNSIRPLALIVIVASIIFLFLQKKVPGIFKSTLLSKITISMLILTTYIFTSHLLGSYISKSINKDIAKYPFGFNIFVGLNHSSKGAWNENDANILNKLTENTDFNAQEVHNKLIELSIYRFKNMTIGTCFDLALKKFKILWKTDDDSIYYIKAGYTKASKIDINKYQELFLLISNIYYYIMLLLCLLGISIRTNKSDLNIIILLFLIISGIVCLHTVVEASGRYHFPAICLFSIIAGNGIYKIISMINSRQ